MSDAYTAAWLAEMWPTVHEEHVVERLTKQKEDRIRQRTLEELQLSSGQAPEVGVA